MRKMGQIGRIEVTAMTFVGLKLCVVVYFLLEVSPKPDDQLTEPTQPSDHFLRGGGGGGGGWGLGGGLGVGVRGGTEPVSC